MDEAGSKINYVIQNKVATHFNFFSQLLDQIRLTTIIYGQPLDCSCLLFICRRLLTDKCQQILQFNNLAIFKHRHLKFTGIYRKHSIQLCTLHTSKSLSVTDTTPPRKHVAANNMVRNCIFAIVTTVQVQVDTW